jgi:hypothetical protein
MIFMFLLVLILFWFKSLFWCFRLNLHFWFGPWLNQCFQIDPVISKSSHLVKAYSLVLINRLSDTSSIPVLFSTPIEKANYHAIFRRMNMTSSTNSRALTTTNRLRNISSTKMSHPYLTFTHYLFQWIRQHLFFD